MNFFWSKKQVNVYYDKNISKNYTFFDRFSKNSFKFFFFFFYTWQTRLIDFYTHRVLAQQSSCVYLFNYFFFDCNIVIKLVNNNHTHVGSISLLWPSGNWSEREVSEFSSLHFCRLLDSRRLLTNYVDIKDYVETHKLSYEYYDLFLNDIVRFVTFI